MNPSATSARRTRAERCRTAVLVLLYTRRHPLLASDIASALKSTYPSDEVHAAVEFLRHHPGVTDAPATITWTTQGWRITQAGEERVRNLLALRVGSTAHAR